MSQAAHVPLAGFRLLGTQEVQTHQLIASLNPTPQYAAIFDERPDGDIVTRDGRLAPSPAT